MKFNSQIAKKNLFLFSIFIFIFWINQKVNAEEIKLNELDKRLEKISEISSTGAYKQGSTDFRSYNDFDKASEHKRKIIGKALQNFLAKAPNIQAAFDEVASCQEVISYNTGQIPSS